MTDPSQEVNLFSIVWGWLSPHFTGGSIGIMATVIFCSRYIIRTMHPLVQWASVFRIEHDILWEDWNQRTGGTFRRPVTSGRGGYTGREHPVMPKEPK